MATIPGALNIAILARLRGTEVLAGDGATAQAITAAIPWRMGMMRKNGALPAGNFTEDAGIDAMPAAPDVGMLQHSIRRFELWSQTFDDTFFANSADALEYLFDVRRSGTALIMNPTGDGKLFDSTLFTGLQGPFFDDNINAFYGLMSFTFLEARP